MPGKSILFVILCSSMSSDIYTVSRLYSLATCTNVEASIESDPVRRKVSINIYKHFIIQQFSGFWTYISVQKAFKIQILKAISKNSLIDNCSWTNAQCLIIWLHAVHQYLCSFLIRVGIVPNRKRRTERYVMHGPQDQKALKKIINIKHIVSVSPCTNLYSRNK